MATRLLKTVKPSGGDYTSLAACIAAQAQDLVSADKYLDIEIDGDWSGAPDTAGMDITGYTTDAAHYINIYTTAACRHRGVWDDTKYRLVVTDETGINNNCNNVRVTGLQIRMNIVTTNVWADALYNEPYESSGVIDLRFSKNIIDLHNTGGGSGSGAYGIHLICGSAASGYCYVWNNAVYATSRQGWMIGIITDNGGGLVMVAYNNTARFCNHGFERYTSGTLLAKNNLSNDSASGDYAGSFHGNSANNISMDATSPNTSYRNKDVDFRNSDDDSDQNLCVLDGAAIDTGVDLHADAELSFSDDITGETRIGTWDIGCFSLPRLTCTVRDVPVSLPSDAGLGYWEPDNTEYAALASDDGAYFDMGGISDTHYKIFDFVFQGVTNTDPIAVTWNGKSGVAPSSKAVYLQIYNWNSSAWETLASNNSAGADTDFTLTGLQTANPAYYYDSELRVRLRVYQSK